MLGPGGIGHRRHARAAGAQLGPANWAMNDGDADDNAADGHRAARLRVSDGQDGNSRNPVVMFCLPFWAMNDGDADDNAGLCC